jgi:hypothetical protein
VLGCVLRNAAPQLSFGSQSLFGLLERLILQLLPIEVSGNVPVA